MSSDDGIRILLHSRQQPREEAIAYFAEDNIEQDLVQSLLSTAVSGSLMSGLNKENHIFIGSFSTSPGEHFGQAQSDCRDFFDLENNIDRLLKGELSWCWRDTATSELKCVDVVTVYEALDKTEDRLSALLDDFRNEELEFEEEDTLEFLQLCFQ